MRNWMATTALALVIGSAAGAQDTAQQPLDPGQPQDPAQQQALGIEGGADALFTTTMIGMPVHAPPQGTPGAIQAMEGFEISAGELAQYAIVGWVSDVLLGRDMSPRAVVVALGDMTMDDAAGALAQEVMVQADRIRFLSDDTVRTLNFAVVDMGIDELQAAPLVDRFAGAAGMAGQAGGMGVGAGGMGAGGAMMQGAPGWQAGRAPMAAPGVAMDGYMPVPVAEISVDNLTGAPVFGVDSMSIGSVSTVMMDPSGGAVDHIVVDVGGFLGIGSREIALGLDEVTVLRDAGWDDLQVHVEATQASLEAMPEYRRPTN